MRTLLCASTLAATSAFRPPSTPLVFAKRGVVANAVWHEVGDFVAKKWDEWQCNGEDCSGDDCAVGEYDLDDFLEVCSVESKDVECLDIWNLQAGEDELDYKPIEAPAASIDPVEYWALESVDSAPPARRARIRERLATDAPADRPRARASEEAGGQLVGRIARL